MNKGEPGGSILHPASRISDVPLGLLQALRSLVAGTGPFFLEEKAMLNLRHLKYRYCTSRDLSQLFLDDSIGPT
jgi:hypothetical protein